MNRRLGLASFLVLPVAAAIGIACNGETLDLGGGEAGTSSETTTGDGGTAADQQVWTGYVENYKFASGTSSVRLTYAVAADGSVEGTARFGDAPLLPTPTAGDPDLDQADSGVLHWDYLEGFLYTLHQGKLDATRFQAGVAPMQLYAGWCSAQTPQSQTPPPGLVIAPGLLPPAGTPPYSCLPYLTSSSFLGFPCTVGSVDGGTADIDCTRLSLCQRGGSCVCEAGACALDPKSETDDVTFDLDVQGNRADGTVVLLTGPNLLMTPGGSGVTSRVPVHLVKQ